MNEEKIIPDSQLQRLVSIDAFRGLTIFIMILVNDLAGIQNIPGWMKHMPENSDGMTFVDVVFPAFLFIVGMSIPLAIKNRIRKGDTPLRLWNHIIIRGLGLLALGLLMVNIGGINAELTGISKAVWGLLMFLSVILVWNQYPKILASDKPIKKYLYTILKYTGILILIVLVSIYRSGTPENPGWMHTKWWGILGLIGWAYLTCCLVYFMFKEEIAALIGTMAFFVILFIGDKYGALSGFSYITGFLDIGSHIGGHSSITLAGMITSLIITSANRTSYQKIKWLSCFTAFMLICGFMLRPLFGIDKNMATPTWCLYSSAISCAIFIALYWITDVKKKVGWMGFISPAASNPLLAYILPDIFYMLLAIFHISILSVYFGEGLLGIMRSLVFTALTVLLTGWLTKRNIRLHL